MQGNSHGLQPLAEKEAAGERHDQHPYEPEGETGQGPAYRRTGFY